MELFENPTFLRVLGKKRWKELKELEGGYLKAIVAFLERFLVLTQIEMNKEIPLEDAAKSSLKKAHDEFCEKNIHISSTMETKAIEFSENLWPFDKELLEWYKVYCRENPLRR